MAGRLNSVNSTKKMFLFQLSPITSILFIKWFGKLKDIYKKTFIASSHHNKFYTTLMTRSNLCKKVDPGFTSIAPAFVLTAVKRSYQERVFFIITPLYLIPV